MSYLLIYRHMMSSNSVVNYSSTLTGDSLALFESYKSEVGNLLQTHSGSFYRKNYQNFYDIVYKFEDSNDIVNFYDAFESPNASSVILDYKDFKYNNPNDIMTGVTVKVISTNTNSNTSVTLKTMEM